MNIPNIITLLRLVSVPLIIWVILQDRIDYAFGLFVLAGVSDAIDGPLARMTGKESEFGRILDPRPDSSAASVSCLFPFIIGTQLLDQ